MELKFGVNLHRGISRLAVDRKLPRPGTDTNVETVDYRISFTAWSADMCGFDMRVPGTQTYYGRLFKQMAEWGVECIKTAFSLPYEAHAFGIETMRAAMDKSRRLMVLRMFSGETRVDWGPHAREYAQGRRVSIDGGRSRAQFMRLENRNGDMGGSAGVDADILPVWRLKLGERHTLCNLAEQQTLIGLWSISRSPLIMGGDLRYLNSVTMAALTSPEVIAATQTSRDNKPSFTHPCLRAHGEWRLLRRAVQSKRRHARYRDRLSLAGPVWHPAVRDTWRRAADGSANDHHWLPKRRLGLYRLSPA